MSEYAPMDTPSTAVQVAAAMVAVVAEHEPGYSTTSSYLRNPYPYEGMGTGCIQGAVLEKLGYPFEEEKPYSGSTAEVMQMLGMQSIYDVDREDDLPPELLKLHQALSVAEWANDCRLPWTAALEGFERVMAGEPSGEVRRLVTKASEKLRALREAVRVKEVVLGAVPCPCGCNAEVKPIAAEPGENPFMPSWAVPNFSAVIDKEMEAMKKVLQQQMQYENLKPAFVTIPVIKSTSALIDAAVS